MKLLMENWRQFLTESPERYYDNYDPEAEDESYTTGAATVGAFIEFLQGVTSGQKLKGIGSDALEFSVGVVTGGYEKFVHMVAKAMHSDKSIMKSDYKDNPYLSYLDFDPVYEQILHPRIFEEFLLELPSALGALDEESLMPDIDQLLEKWLLDKYGITLDGATHADEDFAIVSGQYQRGAAE